MVCERVTFKLHELKYTLINKLSIQYGLSSGTHLMENLHIHLMIYLLECSPSLKLSYLNSDFFLRVDLLFSGIERYPLGLDLIMGRY